MNAQVPRALAVVMAAAMLMPSLALGAPPEVGRGAGPFTQRWIVTLEPGTDARRLSAELAREHRGTVDHVFEHALLGFTFRGSDQAAAALSRNPRVASVIPDRELRIAADTLPAGVQRIDARHPTSPDAHERGFTGDGVSIGILDTGVDLDHPDLAVDATRGINCMGTGQLPDDDHGHGTHVAGTAAGLANGSGVVGVAPGAVVVPIKVLDSQGVGTDATVICGVDHLTALATDDDPANDVAVANMSLGETGGAGHCQDGGLRQAICASVAAGVTYVVAAGNSSVDVSGFRPANFPEVITVSALTDLDGEPGGLGGCYFSIYCDDTFAFFSNRGAGIDVIAPGVRVYSTWMGGGYSSSDGTSMAAPHVAGVAALVKGARPDLRPADVEALVRLMGECPDGTSVAGGADASNCVGQGGWTGDPDGIAEPLANALAAASGASDFDAAPSVAWVTPDQGQTVEGVVALEATASDDVGVSKVAFYVNGILLSEDVEEADGRSATWDTAGLFSGTYSLTAEAWDSAGQRSLAEITVHVGPNQQGDWVGTYGANGYALLAWTATSDLTLLPPASLTIEQGARSSVGVVTDVRALESPDQSERRVGAVYHASQVRLRLTFPAAYSGSLHLYAVDWSTVDRRQRFTVDDGSGAQVASISTSFRDGAWLHFPVEVGAGGAVIIRVDRLAGANVVLNGLFLGEGAPPAPGAASAPQSLAATAGEASVALSWQAPASNGGAPISGYRLYRDTVAGGGTELVTLGNVLTHTDTTAVPGTPYYYTVTALNAAGESPRSNEVTATPLARTVEIPGVQGDWVGTYGANGYALLAWTATSDLTLLPPASLTIEQGARSSVGVVTDVRALESPDQSERRVGAVYHASQVRLRLTFPAAYSGSLHLYAVDWSTVDRRQRFTVDDGSGAQVASISTSFRDGAWLHFPVEVGAGGAVIIRVDRLAGANVVLNGLFLGEGAPPAPGAASAPQSLAATAGEASVALSWQAPASNGGAPISGYRLYRDTVAGGGTELVTLGNVLTHTDTTAVPGTPYYYTVTALNAAGESPRSNEVTATPLARTVEIPGVQGDWVGTYGANGYALLAWTATSDLTLLPPASLTIEQGARSSVGVVTDVRALESPDQSERRVGAVYHASQVRLRLTFPAAYSGSLHLYAVDWSTVDRRQRFTVDDGSGAQVASISTSFRDGAWLHFPVEVGAGGAVIIRVDRLAGANVVLNGLFLGEGAPPAPGAASAPQSLAATAGEASVALSWQAPASNGGAPISGYRLYRDTVAGGGTELVTLGNVLTHTDTTAVPGTPYYYTVTALNAAGESPRSNEVTATPLARTVEIPGVQGDWVGTYGANGYALLAWTATSDLTLLPPASLTIEQGARSSVGVVTDVRALESPDQSERRVGAVYHASQVRLRLTFPAAYSGSLHLYAVDWSTVDRRQRFTVDDGSGAQVASISTSFRDGAWLHFPVEVGAGGAVIIRVDRLAGANVVLNGLFLGD